MSDSEDNFFSSSPANRCSTPPLSPTKTVSTEDWSSPRTPWSPRKAHSCDFFRGLQSSEPFYLTPPASPTKTKSPAEFSDFQALRDDLVVEHDRQPPQHLAAADQNNYRQGPLPAFNTGRTAACNPSLYRSGESSHCDTRFFALQTPNSADSLSAQQSGSLRSFSSVSDTAITLHTDQSTSPHRVHQVLSSCPKFRSALATSTQSSTPRKRLPVRCASSPLRSSQWTARGGLLQTLRRGQSNTPDRFIASRRPPTVTRESFELNKPNERLDDELRLYGGRCPNRYPFSRRLRRSGRLNDELRGLREAHSQITGRANALQRNSSLSYRRNSYTLGNRQVSAGAVWNVGGPSAVSDTVIGSSTGRGGMFGINTMAPLYRSAFLSRADPHAEFEVYESRLALAMDVDQSQRILQHSSATISPDATKTSGTLQLQHTWRDNAWARDDYPSLPQRPNRGERRPVPILPFRVLDAPQLRDDYYCSLLAYSMTAKCLAVGLGNFVHLWSERSGVDTPASLNTVPPGSLSESHHITSVDFSSIQGGQAILAVGRADGRITLWSPLDPDPRFDATQPKPISYVSWRPTTVPRPSMRDRAITVSTEELLIRDEVGHIYFYSVEWPSQTQTELFGWHGAMTLRARMTIHTQQICGLAWAPDGDMFASGGNDNNCFLFETKRVLQPNSTNKGISTTLDVREGPEGESIFLVSNVTGPVIHLLASAARHKWALNAAIKAIAFCPWQRGLIAIGGGSNDRCIHFYHARSGTCLATIDCAAQVTSLVWSETRREIAATFGFTQPEHPYRIAVFKWPSCEQAVAVPWWDENRALFAVAYPGVSAPGTRANQEDEGNEESLGLRGDVVDGCIVVAASDMAIRFHEIWSTKRNGVGGGVPGLLGGSDILEGLHGIERAGPVIR